MDLRREEWRLTASAALHGFILAAEFEYPMAELKTKYDKIMNIFFMAPVLPAVRV